MQTINMKEPIDYVECELQNTRDAIAFMSDISQSDHPFRHEIITGLKDREYKFEQQLEYCK